MMTGRAHSRAVTALLLSLTLGACKFTPPEANSTPRDAGSADRAQPDAIALDADLQDVPPHFDASETDAGEIDAGETDAGESDASEVDGGATDAEIVDTGSPDTGLLDAGPPVDSGLAFSYTPSNFDPLMLPPPGAPIIVESSGCAFNSTTMAFDPASTGCLSTTPVVTEVMQPTGNPIVVLSTTGLSVMPTSTFDVYGDRPVVIAVYGNAVIEGLLFTGALGTLHGAGGNGPDCAGVGTGAPGQVSSSDGGGGGGGAFGTDGAAGGDGADGTGGGEGSLDGTDELVPLRAGCAGGTGGENSGSSGLGGGGGGAIQVSASGLLHVLGRVLAPGGAGRGGGDQGGGGGGGGSGGAILLEADSIQFEASARLFANGGAGGGGGGAGNGDVGTEGQSVPTGNTTPATGGPGGGNDGGDGGNGAVEGTGPTDGFAGTGSNGGGGGGGGSVGRVRINAASQCSIGVGAFVSPAPTSNQAPGCP